MYQNVVYATNIFGIFYFLTFFTRIGYKLKTADCFAIGCFVVFYLLKAKVLISSFKPKSAITECKCPAKSDFRKRYCFIAKLLGASKL
jgi:hypothetical protein